MVAYGEYSLAEQIVAGEASATILIVDDETAILDDGDRATTRDAQGAVCGNALRRLPIHNHRDTCFLDG